MLPALDAFFTRLGRSQVLSPRNFQYACAISGVLCSFCFLFGFVACGYVPPTKPYWSAEETVQHFVANESRIQGGVALLLLSGMFYLPLTAAISGQMRRVPNLHYSVSALQLSSGAAGIFTFMLPPMILGVANYRLERDPQITQALSDMFWITALMPWPTFMTQNFAFAYAVIIDSRPKPLFPKYIAIVNIIAPILFVPAIGMHCVKIGPLAWNGGLTFWMAGSLFCTQLVVESYCLAMAISNEPAGGEKIVDNFPTSLVHEDSLKQSITHAN
jgi:hypothetical protein